MKTGAKTVRWSLLLVVLLVAGPASAAPIVFDFEDGLQGWQLGGSAQRVQTQILGGEWAIFGDGLLESRAWILRDIDLTNISSVTVDAFVVSGDPIGLSVSGGRILGVFVEGFSMLLQVSDPALNPALRTASLMHNGGGFHGVYTVHFVWWCLSGDPLCADRRSVAFIDNITFHPIPEPGHLGLLGLLGVLGLRRFVGRWSC